MMNHSKNELLSTFEAPLNSYDTLYGDNVKQMVDRLPHLLEKCQALVCTDLGTDFRMQSLPAFVLGSNKLEGTSSPIASEEETFQVLADWMKDANEELDAGDGCTWDEEGQNSTKEAWYEQCKAHTRAAKLMEEWAEKGEPLTTEKLLQCHKIMMGGALTESGKPFQSHFRTADEPVMAGNFAFPNGVEQVERMKAALTKREAGFGAVHPVQWACALMLDILTNHPFPNGNGRLARMCFAYALMRQGAPCMVVFTDNHSHARKHYIRAVQHAQGQRDVPHYKLIHSMAIVGLYAMLANMVIFCESHNACLCPKGGEERQGGGRLSQF